MDKLWYLSQINIMDELPETDLEEIARLAPMNRTPKGTLLLTPDTPPQGLYLLKKGKVRLYKLNREGKEFTLGILGDGNIFGEVEAFATGTRNIYAEALEDTLICLLSKSDFEGLMQERPQLALKMIRVLSERLSEAEEMLESLAYGSVQKRLLYLLSKLGQNFGEPHGDYIRLNISLSHQDLAAMIGATRETVSATIAEMVRKGLIKKSRFRKIISIHPEKVQKAMDMQP
ncbi:Crp/Fnr family transcriptional regulator [Desmospora profundinema]|uniref:CRP/FNR family transcriptional regulator n=1 Tax=Desmospora profundinema TaxID=1571184 RepID=A0ABU1IQZ9_9BACL|nr:Crp/Fnr family transcriptional regulator [Desmospora profundinema]MDR6226848.1 CRP/FNR family transcriptional regulator [Desmospora profundinema]